MNGIVSDAGVNGQQHFRNLEMLLLRRVAVVTQAHVSLSMGKDKSTISRIFAGNHGVYISEMDVFLAALGLIVIESDSDTVTIPRERYEALRLLAKDGI